MNQTMPVETRLRFSKTFAPGTAEAIIGRYTLRPIPTGAAGCEAVLTFRNEYAAPEGGGSHPEEEASIVSMLLALFLETRVTQLATRINNVDIPTGDLNSRYRQFLGTMVPEDAAKHLDAVFGLPLDLARQFIRATKCFSFALEFIPADPTFAFFLLVVAIECLASQDAVIPYAELKPPGKSTERFCRFVTSNLRPQEIGTDEQNEALLRQLLKTIYYSHRSGFAHGGKEVSDAALKADEAGSSYFKHVLDGKEVKTPGLGWFAKVARSSLLGYLEHRKVAPGGGDALLLAKVAAERSVLKVKMKKTMQQFSLVTLDDIEYR